MASFPADLNIMRDGFSISQHDNARRTLFESGTISQVKTLTRTRYTINCSILVDDADYAEFTLWAKTDALNWFDYTGFFKDSAGAGITTTTRVVGESIQRSKTAGGWIVRLAFEYYD